MSDLTSSQLQLFSRLSKILADTFQDIHKICVRQSKLQDIELEVGGPIKRIPTNFRDQWASRVDDSRYMDIQYGRSDIDDDSDKQPKSRNKVRPHYMHDGVRDKKQKKKKIAKWQKQGKPRPPLNAFMLFLKDSKLQIMEAKPELTPSEVSTYASALWNQLSQEEKDKYRLEYKEHKIKYDEQLREFNQKQRINGVNGGDIQQFIKNTKGNVTGHMSHMGHMGNMGNIKQRPQKLVKDILDNEMIMGDMQNSSSDSMSQI